MTYGNLHGCTPFPTVPSAPSPRRAQYNTWLNSKATDEQRFLLEAAFTSIEFYMDHHKEHSKPWGVRYVADVPVVGKLIGFLWEVYVERRTKRRELKRARKQV